MRMTDAFEKLHVEKKERVSLVGLLEELNLPPRIVEYVRRNQRNIYIVFTLLVVGVISWSLYGAWDEKRTERSGSALAAAKEESGAARLAALQGVQSEYSGTKAALWAQIEYAHEESKNGNYAEAAAQYLLIRGKTERTNPLYPLLTLGIAQTREGEGDFPSAFVEYEILKDINGYRSIGALGAARLHEMRGEREKALAVYEDYLSSFEGAQSDAFDREFVQGKILQLKAKQ